MQQIAAHTIHKTKKFQEKYDNIHMAGFVLDGFLPSTLSLFGALAADYEHFLH